MKIKQKNRGLFEIKKKSMKLWDLKVFACELTMIGFQRVGPPPCSST